MPPVTVLPKDISGLRSGNTGVDYVHRFDSGKAGPTVVVNGLMHGNEFCGMSAITRLLEHDVRPKIGTMILSLSNVEAYGAFDPDDPGATRFMDEDMNRVWTDDRLAGREGPETREVVRARELWPIFREADHLLDLHTTLLGELPFWVLPQVARGSDLATAVTVPAARLQLTGGGMIGVPLLDAGPFADPTGKATALVAECGQHWAPEAQDVAFACALRFLTHFGMVDAEQASALEPKVEAGPKGLFRVTHDLFAETADWHYPRVYTGLDRVESGEILAMDGEKPVHAPEGGCWVALARPSPKQGGEAMTLADFIPD